VEERTGEWCELREWAVVPLGGGSSQSLSEGRRHGDGAG
jgi:hypothetical protein